MEEVFFYLIHQQFYSSNGFLQSFLIRCLFSCRCLPLAESMTSSLCLTSPVHRLSSDTQEAGRLSIGLGYERERPHDVMGRLRMTSSRKSRFVRMLVLVRNSRIFHVIEIAKKRWQCPDSNARPWALTTSELDRSTAKARSLI